MRYFIILFFALTAFSSAQTIDTITKGTPLYPDWQYRINRLIWQYNLDVDADLLKREAITRDNGTGMWIYIDSARGDDANDGTSFFRAVKTWPRVSELMPYDLGGGLLNIAAGPGTYTEGLNRNYINGNIYFHIIDSTEWELYKTSGYTGWNVPMKDILEDAVVLGADTSDPSYNPFLAQGPVVMDGAGLRFADFDRAGSFLFITYYRTTWNAWNAAAYNPAQRLVFLNGASITIECGYLGEERSHLTFDGKSSSTEYLLGLWINNGRIGGLYFARDSAVANTAWYYAFRATPSLPGIQDHIAISNKPGASNFHIKNMRRIGELNSYRTNIQMTEVNTNTWTYENDNPAITKGEIDVEAGWFGTILTDTSKTSLMIYSGEPMSINRGDGFGFARVIAGNMEAPLIKTNDLITATSSNVAGEATLGAGDSVQVTIDDIEITDVFSLNYIGGVAPTKQLSYSINVAEKLTIYGDSGRNVAWMRIKRQ